MATKTTVNGSSANVCGLDMAKAVYQDLSPQSRAVLPEPTAGNAAAFYQSLIRYDAVANEWANALVNRIMYSWIKSAEAYDPLDFVKRGNVGPGFSIQEIYVDMLDAVDWNECDDYAADIFRSETPRVYALYHSVTFQKRVKVTVKNELVSRAFVSWDGVEELIARMVSELYESMRDAEYQATKGLLATAYAGGWCYPVSVSPVDINGTVDRDDMETNTMKIRAAVGRLKFAKRDYNFMGVKNRSTTNDILFITTPEYIAAQDVKVLASAFNMSKAEFLGRVVEVDDFGGAEKNGAVGFIIDREWFQIYRTIEKMSEQYNGPAMFWNYWYNVQGIYSVSMFSNALVLVDSSKLDTIASVAVTASQRAAKCAGTQILATVNGTAGDNSKYHYSKLNWSISGQTSTKTTISPYGMLVVGGDETASTITVKVESAQDPSKTASAAVTITG